MSSAIDWDAVVAGGTRSLPELRTEPAEAPLKAFDARTVTWSSAESLIRDAEAAGADPDRIRLAALLLAELAVVVLRRHAPWRRRLPDGLRALNKQEEKERDDHRAGEKDEMTALGEFTLLHHNDALPPEPIGRGRSSDPRVVDVFSQLARHLTTVRPRIEKPYAHLNRLRQTVYPPLVEAVGRGDAKRLQYQVLKHRAGRRKRAPDLARLLRRLPRLHATI